MSDFSVRQSKSKTLDPGSLVSTSNDTGVDSGKGDQKVVEAPELDKKAIEIGQQSEGRQQRTERGGTGVVAGTRTYQSSGTPAERASAHVKALAALAQEAPKLSSDEVVARLGALAIDGEAIHFLWTPSGEPFRLKLNGAYGKLAAAHPDASMPGRATPEELANLENADAATLKKNLEGMVLHWKESLGYTPYEPGSLDGLDRGALLQKNVDALVALRTNPLGYLADISAVHEAQFRGAAPAELAKIAENILDKWGDQRLSLNLWLKTIAAQG